MVWMDVTEDSVDAIIERCRGLRIGEKEYKDMVRMLMAETLSDIPSPKVVKLIEMLISAEAKQIYLNEVKNYLLVHDEDLYKRYAGMFLDNPGVFEAFGVRGKEREPVVEDGPKMFKSLRPELTSLGSKRKPKTLKKAIRRESRMSAYRKMVREKSASIEYKKKVDAMYRKARKE
ncbi:hypothetical protein [Encephalitozoon cuniculi GB-M1]|uniref:Uncharacterized protein n=1 Tax=Encephalitozoon cuniculi (strain GB-M1) TaxID=284813 RepID=Q8SVX1_ENCCU|nr:uncharacterized protein ECU04_0360 [Encephalitozoon cuniculi GB-M1]CAD25223.1 hypothetical protein [Encephalitozoon cuniculi GB-M1]